MNMMHLTKIIALKVRCQDIVAGHLDLKATGERHLFSDCKKGLLLKTSWSKIFISSRGGSFHLSHIIILAWDKKTVTSSL